ncbi:MAG: DUF6452 family protein [Flavobacteriaceae bacterium]
MNRLKIVFIILLGIICFSACEKDDICVDGNTPLLVIRFYDFDDPEEIKAVPNLRIAGLGQEFTVNTIADRTSLDSIGIPLRIGETSTGFYFIMDSETDENEIETGNIDTLSFSYESKEIFISRACGFIVNYDKLDSSLETGTDNWIKSIVIDTTFITNSTQAHVKIFH